MPIIKNKYGKHTGKRNKLTKKFMTLSWAIDHATCQEKPLALGV
jgi:hypothetical protein